MKKRIGLTALAAAILFTSPVQAADIKVGFTQDVLTMDPANHRKRETETILRNMYDGIVTRTPAMDVVPEIAKSWEVIDSTTYEFNLREGVRFHSGDILTAEDIKFTFDRLIVEGAMEGQTSPRKSLLGPMESVEVIDDLTVRFHFKTPWPIFTAMLPFQEVVSKAFVERVGGDGLSSQVNGTGPFKLKEWRKGESVIMERFDDYYGGSSDIKPVGKACVDQVVFKVIPESASRVAALLSGDIDIMTELPVHSISQVERSKNADVVSVNGTRSFYISMNNQRPPFDDLRVRQAANHALDKELIIDRILSGKATEIHGILSPDAFGHNPKLKAYKYNIKKAKQLLADAGYPNGIDVTLDVEGPFKDTAEAAASLLAKAGIRAQVSVSESSILKDNWRTNGQKPIDGDMWFTSWGNGSLDPTGIFEPVMMTDARGNSTGFSNADVDRMLTEASQTAIPADREKLYQAAEEIVNEQAPAIFLWVPQDIYGVSKRLKGFKPSPDSRINLHDVCAS